GSRQWRSLHRRLFDGVGGRRVSAHHCARRSGIRSAGRLVVFCRCVERAGADQIRLRVRTGDKSAAETIVHTYITNMRKLLPALFLTISCVSPMGVEPVSVPLQYKTMAGAADFPALDPCAAVSDVSVTDVRADAHALGQRFVQGQGGPAAA